MELCGHRGWYCSVLFLVGVGLYVCVCVTHTIPSNVISLDPSNRFVHFILLCLYLSHYIYLGEEVEAAQAADDAVDLREPSAFTTGL